jgi:hypothetical protein
MKTLLVLFVLWTTQHMILAQDPKFYTGKNGEKHLIGPFNLNDLEDNKAYQSWFKEGYDNFTSTVSKPKWTRHLKSVEVEIYLGTWCGDSKYWVPKFVRLWDHLGLNRNQLKFTALYDRIEGEHKYKQGPNGEEKGKHIHRVPTFIFNRNGEEVARIVESPITDLETDLAQIALGYPSRPNYRGASYMLRLFESETMDEIKAKESTHLNAAFRLIKGNPSELNTLGYVLLESERIEEALLTFYFNTRYFPFNPNVYDSYAEALATHGQTRKAKEMYKKVLLLDRSNSNAAKQIEILKN